MKTVGLLFFFAIAVAAAAKEERIQFKGDPLGITLAEWDAKHQVTHPDYTFVSRDGLGRFCVYAEPVPKPDHLTPAVTIANVAATAHYLFCGDETDVEAFKWGRKKEAAERLRLVTVRITIEQSNFDKVVEALKEKFGEPTESTTTDVANRMGAHFPSRSFTWRMGQDVIHAAERDGKIDQSRIAYMDWTAIQEFTARGKAADKERAKDL